MSLEELDLDAFTRADAGLVVAQLSYRAQVTRKAKPFLQTLVRLYGPFGTSGPEWVMRWTDQQIAFAAARDTVAPVRELFEYRVQHSEADCFLTIAQLAFRGGLTTSGPPLALIRRRHGEFHARGADFMVTWIDRRILDSAERLTTGGRFAPQPGGIAHGPLRRTGRVTAPPAGRDMPTRAVTRTDVTGAAPGPHDRAALSAPPSIAESFQRLATAFALMVEQPERNRSAWALLSPPASDSNTRYRYAYSVWWDPTKPPSLRDTVAWVLLNPLGSDSAERRRRPTLGYCRSQAQRWGYSGLVIVNLFAYRANAPAELLRLPKEVAIGPHNDQVLQAISRLAFSTVAAWGNGGALWQRSHEVRSLIDDLRCVADRHGPALTDRGEPRHPRTLPRIGMLSPLP